MKTPVRLWVRLKVIDLVTQTARITLEEKLDFGGALAGLTHYWFWAMDAEAAGADAALEEIDRAVRLDGAFTNQNKHFYRLETAGGAARGDLALDRDYPAGGGAGLFALDCFVSEKDPGRAAGYAERLNARLRGAAVSGMRCGEVWRVVVRAADERAAREIAERILVSRSRREGLLLNPHYQSYEILAAKRLG